MKNTRKPSELAGDQSVDADADGAGMDNGGCRANAVDGAACPHVPGVPAKSKEAGTMRLNELACGHDEPVG